MDLRLAIISSDKFRPLLSRIGNIDIFLHDSDHSFRNMMLEFKTAWPYLRLGGILIADDASLNDAFLRFARYVKHLPIMTPSGKKALRKLP